jgi:hypothetical protein
MLYQDTLSERETQISFARAQENKTLVKEIEVKAHKKVKTYNTLTVIGVEAVNKAKPKKYRTLRVVDCLENSFYLSELGYNFKPHKRKDILEARIPPSGLISKTLGQLRRGAPVQPIKGQLKQWRATNMAQYSRGD